jgi:hypothetical protein
MQICREQINEMARNNRPLLRRDLVLHLTTVHPKLFDIHPLPYLMAVIDDSIDLALSFGLVDVQAMRVFLQLRWDVASGFYLQSQIFSGLKSFAHLGMGCWEQLSQPEWGDAWLQAHEFDKPQHWRGRMWGESLQ